MVRSATAAGEPEIVLQQVPKMPPAEPGTPLRRTADKRDDLVTGNAGDVAPSQSATLRYAGHNRSSAAAGTGAGSNNETNATKRSPVTPPRLRDARDSSPRLFVEDLFTVPVVRCLYIACYSGSSADTFFSVWLFWLLLTARPGGSCRNPRTPADGTSFARGSISQQRARLGTRNDVRRAAPRSFGMRASRTLRGNSVPGHGPSGRSQGDAEHASSTQPAGYTPRIRCARPTWQELSPGPAAGRHRDRRHRHGAGQNNFVFSIC